MEQQDGEWEHPYGAPVSVLRLSQTLTHSSPNCDNISTADRSMSLKFGTEFDHVTADSSALKRFRSRVKLFQHNRSMHRWVIED